MPTASVDVGMPYVIWNRETGEHQLIFDYYEAQMLAQQMGGAYVTKYDDIAANPGHPLYNDPRLARAMAPYLDAQKRARAQSTVLPATQQEVESTVLPATQQEVQSTLLPATLGAPPTVTPMNDQVLFTPGNVLAQQAIDFNIPTVVATDKPNLRPPAPVLGETLEELQARAAREAAIREAALRQQQQIDGIEAANAQLYAEHDAAVNRNAAIAENDAYRKQQEAGRIMQDIQGRVAAGHAQANENMAALEAQRANSQPVVPPAPVVPPVKEQIEIVREQLGQPSKSKWDWDNPNIRTYSTYMEPPATTPAIPANVVRDGFGNPIRAGDGYLRSRTDEEILRDEQDPYWWMR